MPRRQLLDGSAAGDGRRRCARRSVSATALVRASLDRIAATDGSSMPSPTCTPNARWRAPPRSTRHWPRATRRRARLPLLGVPFAVKNLFDVAGVTTLAGSKIEREQPAGDARRPAGRRASSAPARCWSARSTWTSTPTASRPRTRTTARRATRTTRRASPAARRAARRRRSPPARCRSRSAPTPTARSACPSSLCGIFGLKPTYGRLPRNGSYPFVASLDHLGPVRAHRRTTWRSSTTRCRASTAPTPPASRGRSSRPPARSARGIDGLAHRRRSAAISHELADDDARAARGARRPGARRAPHGRPAGGRARARRRLPDHQRRRRGAAPGRPAHACRRLRAAVARPLPRRRAAARGLGRCRRSACGAGSRCARPRLSATSTC